jgi:release factor glutamine methyltransferase
MTIGAALQQGARLLEQGAVAAPRLTADVLLGHALGCGREYLYAHPEEELSEVAWIHFGRYLHDRLQGKPVQYIIRRQEFYGRRFKVTPAVLIPRPETEHVIEAALELSPRPATGLDIGCGSGAIAVTLQLETGARYWATDISTAALAVAAENASALGASVHLVACDVASAIATGSVELVVSNPPYVPLNEKESLQREVRDYEPHVALFSGPGGLDLYQKIIRDAERVLKPRGWLVVELGFKTSEAVRAMLGPRWSDVSIRPDLAGIPRVLAARLRS